MTLTATLCKMCMNCIVRCGILKSKKKRATFIFIFLSICKMSRVIVDQRRQVAEGENLDKLREVRVGRSRVADKWPEKGE